MRFTRYDQISTTDETNGLVAKAAQWHLSQIPDSSTGREISGLITCGDFAGLVNYPVDYSRVGLCESLHVRQSLAFYQKRVDLDIGVDRKAVALESFEKAELLNSETRHIFNLRSRGEFAFTRGVESILFSAQRKIERILGDVPPLSDLRLKFGPGSTTQTKKKDASSRRKLGETFACSKDLPSDFLAEVLGEMPHWVGLTADLSVVDVRVLDSEARLHFVPKSAKTDRSIGVEPSLNGMVQLGIGAYMAKRLKQAGVDISDQSLNQKLAREGSLTGALATLDLSSASDTVSTALVLDLLPYEWVDFLSKIRSEVVVLPSGERKSQLKFSSMGNGYTFPLETLLFFALAKASAEFCECDGPVNAYGDDIIVPTGAYEMLVRVLTSVGFLVNTSKSFAAGPFRESCGKDYYMGTDIRPVYLKDRLSAADCFILHNHYARKQNAELATLFSSFLAEHLQVFGPDGYGDGHLIGDSCLAPHKRNMGWCGSTFETFTLRGRSSIRPSKGDFVFPLYSVYADPPRVDDVAHAIIENKVRLRPLRHGGAVWASKPTSRYSRGELSTVLPGSCGYKLIKVYILA